MLTVILLYFTIGIVYLLFEIRKLNQVIDENESIPPEHKSGTKLLSHIGFVLSWPLLLAHNSIVFIRRMWLYCRHGGLRLILAITKVRWRYHLMRQKWELEHLSLDVPLKIRARLLWKAIRSDRHPEELQEELQELQSKMLTDLLTQALEI